MVRARLLLTVLAVLALAGAVLTAAPPPPAAAAVTPELVSFNPFRAFDTRTGAKPAAGATLQAQVAGRAGVPAGVPAVSLNVTVASPAAAGSITVFPCGSAKPATPTLYFAAGQAVANAVIAKPGTGGNACIAATASTHVIVDIGGYWRIGSAFTATLPARAYDTTLAAGATKILLIAGRSGVPVGAKAAAVNFTVVSPAAAGSLTIWPCGTKPTTTALSYAAGRTTSAAQIAGLNTSGNLCVAATTAVRVLLDITGHATGGSLYLPIAPATGGAIPIAAGGTLQLQVGGRFGLPAGAGTANLTLTTSAPASGGDLTVYPCGDPKPAVSLLNYTAGAKVSNSVMARIGAGGKVCVFAKATTTVSIAVAGYYKGTDIGSGAWAVDGPCAILPGGYVKCWSYGVITTQPGVVGATAISQIDSYACVNVGGGRIQCWPIDGSLAPSTVTGISGATALAVQQSHTCVIVAGGVVKCWGSNVTGQLGAEPVGLIATVPGLTGAVSIAVAGAYRYLEDIAPGHSCAVLASGAVKCWGWNASGQLGNGTTTDSMTPVSVIGFGAANPARAVATTLYGACALLRNGTVQCWGDGATRPAAKPGITGAAQITASAHWRNRYSMDDASHRCVLVEGGQVRCWGANTYGELGDGTTVDRAQPVTVPGISAAAAVTAAEGVTCALLPTTAVQCWGAPYLIGSTASGLRPRAVAVTALTGAAAVATGAHHTCALVAGSVKCWGDAYFSQGAASDTFQPLVVAGVPATKAIDASADGTCATTTAGTVYCWGYSGIGEDAGPFSAPSPTGLAGITGASAVAAFDRSAGPVCYLTSAGAVGCVSSPEEPARIVIASGATAVSAGGDQACARMSNGTVRCWDAALTVKDPGLTNNVAVSVGESHACAVLSDGTVRCWGSNLSGQLGDGTRIDRAAPVTVAGISTAKTVAAGSQHSCAKLADGTARCWGSNTDGQIGDGTFTDRLQPTAVAGLAGTTDITAGWAHSCARMSDGTAKCWGLNYSGQVGVNPGWLPEFPVPGL